MATNVSVPIWPSSSVSCRTQSQRESQAEVKRVSPCTSNSRIQAYSDLQNMMVIIRHALMQLKSAGVTDVEASALHKKGR
jgi:hypothetical protein